MAKKLGNCASIVNLDEIVHQCQQNGPAFVAPLDRKFEDLSRNDPIVEIWKTKYKLEKEGGTVGWDMFFPDFQFDKELLLPFLNFVNLKNPTALWVTRIRPGCFAPVHWDVRKNENELEGLDFSRFHCHLCTHSNGHMFIVDDELIYDSEKGDIYQWNSRKSIHAGANFGLLPKWMIQAW